MPAAQLRRKPYTPTPASSRKKPDRGGRLDPGRRRAARESGVWAELDGRRLARTSCRCGERLKLDLVAELGELRDKTVGFDLGRPAVEVVGPRVVVVGAVLEHVVDRGQHRGGDGADGFLRAAFAAPPVELGLIVAVLFAAGRPGALNQHCLEPRSAFAQTRGFAF